jgi:predicted DNA-binding transcriptional regulator YafY
VTIAEYWPRFGVSLRSFRRDLALIREAGFYLEAATAGTYRMVCFARATMGRSVQRRLRLQWVLADQHNDRPISPAWTEAADHRFVPPTVAQR